MTGCGKSGDLCTAVAAGLLAAWLTALAPGLALAQTAPAPQVPQASQAPQTPATGTEAAPPAGEQSTPAPAARVFPPQPPALDRSGFLNQLGVWWSDGFANFNAKMKDAKDQMGAFNSKSSEAAKDAAAATQDAMRNAAEATKSATAAVVRLPNTRIIEVREHCKRAPNGGPDCQEAASTACRGKGFNSGQPLDVRTAEECPVGLANRSPVPITCPTETVVLRAVCQ